MSLVNKLSLKGRCAFRMGGRVGVGGRNREIKARRSVVVPNYLLLTLLLPFEKCPVGGETVVA